MGSRAVSGRCPASVETISIILSSAGRKRHHFRQGRPARAKGFLLDLSSDRRARLRGPGGNLSAPWRTGRRIAARIGGTLAREASRTAPGRRAVRARQKTGDSRDNPVPGESGREKGSSEKGINRRQRRPPIYDLNHTTVGDVRQD